MTHPMLQPSDWSMPPERLVGEWPRERVSVYQLVWSMAEACVFAPPRLRHRRTVVELDGYSIAVAVAIPETGYQGYWRVRRDEPKFGWPLAEAALPAGELMVESVHVVGDAPSVGALLLSADIEDWLSPAAAPHQLQQLLEGAAPLITAPSPAGPVTLTKEGEAVLHDAYSQRRGQVRAALASRAALVAAVEAGEIGTEEALSQADITNAAAIARTIDHHAQAWAGTPSAQVWAQQAIAEIEPPKTQFPEAFDPERHLGPDHPFRRIRRELEVHMAQSENWILRTPEEQARARWIALTCPEAAEPAKAMFRLDAWWLNPVALWLIGASPSIAKRIAQTET